VGEIDAIEQHRQLGRIELGAERAFVEGREPETALLQPLVVEDEAAVVPGQDLHSIAAA